MHCSILRLSFRCVFIFAAILTALPGAAQSGWSNASANLTVAELLNMYFEAKLSSPESNALNSYNMVSFYPAETSDQAIVVVIQTWRDDKARSSADLRKNIREASAATYGLFKAISRSRLVQSRWHIVDPSECFIIRHVRYDDLAETIGVTIGNNTFFDAVKYDDVREYVKRFGGIWSW